MRLRIVIVAVLIVASGVVSRAQSTSHFQVAAQLTTAQSTEFDTSDVGVGGRLSWLPFNLIGVDAEFNWFPSDIPDRAPVTSGRTEGLFGVTAGPTFGAFRVFGKARPGFLTFAQPSSPIACIAIFPPTLGCTLAGGETVLALDLGGGVDIALPGSTHLRADLGDRLVRYPGPAISRDGSRHDNPFFGHDFRFSVGGGLRF